MTVINLQRSLETGIQPFRVTNVEDKPSQSGFMTTTLSLIGIGQTNAGVTHTEWLSHSPRAWFRMIQFLDSIGAPTRGQWDTTEFVGKVCWGMVESQYNERRSRDEMRVTEWVRKPDDAEDQLADESILAALQNEISQVVANSINELDAGGDVDIPF